MQSASTPAVVAQASTSATMEVDGGGAPSRKTAYASAVVIANAEMPERDRPSEFLTEATDADEVRSVFEEFAAECQGLLETATAFDAGAMRTASLTSRGGRSRSSDTVTAAWALIHALAHLREHVGHAELTRQAL